MKYIQDRNTYIEEGLKKWISNKFNKPNFEKVLINLWKYIDGICPDNVDIFKINDVKIENRVGEEAIYSSHLHLSSVFFDVNSNFTKKIEKSSKDGLNKFGYNTKSSQNNYYIKCGAVIIKLIEDNNNFIIITLEYNKDNKFDMITWNENMVKNNKTINHRETTDISIIKDDIRQYLIDNKLIGVLI